MTIRFRWLEALPDFSGVRYAEPPPWPQALLQRHNGRMLRPTDAVRDSDGEPVGSTAYRADALLIPDSVASDEDLLALIGRDIGCTLTPPPPLADVLGPGVGNQDRAERLADLPRPVRVAPAADAPERSAGAVVPFDAWIAAQQIRSITRRGTEKQKLALTQVSVDHLLIGTSFGGVPTYEPQDPRVPNNLGGYAPEGRHPVSAMVLKPQRTSIGGKRRPVVAVLDTGLRQHPWFDDLKEIAEGKSKNFLHIELLAQTALGNNQPPVAGLPTSDVLTGYLDEPVYAAEFAERVNPACGHGTFITGLIHQHAPNADVLSVRVLRPDNVGYESDLLLALWLLADRADQAQQGTAPVTDMIDIVSISLGYYHESKVADKATRLREAIDRLTDKGVIVVASAGNDSTARPFLPAAIASVKRAADDKNAQLPPRPPVVGVGALNPNATTSWYSNGGPSASCEAPGTCLISTFPPDVAGSIGANNIAGRSDRESVDQDDYRSAFAMWSGTSFAAPLVAAALANRLVDLGTDAIGKAPTRTRAVKALREFAETTWTEETASIKRRADAAGAEHLERKKALKKLQDAEALAAANP